VFMQALAFLLYLVFSCIVLFLWPSYKLSIRNIIVFVGFGAAGFLFVAATAGILAGAQNTIEIGLRLFGTKFKNT